MNEEIKNYRGNKKLKRVNQSIDWEPWMVDEYIKCANDALYFIENYIKIIHVDKGLINIELRDYQRDLIQSFVNNRFTLGNLSRQSGKSTAYVAFCVWYITFHEYKVVGLFANKQATSRQILGRVQLAYENLPQWMQQGVVEYNKGSFELENNSKIVAFATSPSSGRSESFSVIIIDEMAHIGNEWDEFYAAVQPTISSGNETKLIGVSTPRGLNHWYAFVQNARKPESEWHLVEADWKAVPGRGEKWKQETLAAINYDEELFAQEYELEFIGSSGTLIAGWKLKELVSILPEEHHEERRLKVYEKPRADRVYAIGVDVGEGVGLDYSACQVIDITDMPYKQVAVFNSNRVNPMDFAQIIYRLGKYYRDAYVLVETNFGSEVTSVLHYEYQYENLIRTAASKGGDGAKKVSGGFGGTQIQIGVKTTKTVKASGCSVLKMLVEQNQLILVDMTTIEQLSMFVRVNNSYEADAGNDDLVMCLVIFAWLSSQTYFQDLTNNTTLGALRSNEANSMTEDLPPAGFFDGGADMSESDSYTL